MAFKISPVCNGQVFSNLGTPGAGYKVFAYQSGSFSILQTTYTTSAGSVQNANPVVCDSSGRVPVMFLDSTKQYNIVLTASDGTSVIQTWDGISVA